MQEKNKPMNKSSTVKAVDGLELKVGSPAHRQKFPERYGYNYTSSLDQALYPKLGTAPSEKQIIKWKLEESPVEIVKNPHMKKAITDAEIQKKLDKLRGPHMWNQIYDDMSPHEKGSHNAEQRKKGYDGKTGDPINKVDDSGPVKYDKNGYPDKATPEQFAAAAYRLERHRQMTGEPDKPKTKLKKINPFSGIKIPIPTVNFSLLRDPKREEREAALEKMRVSAFTRSSTDKDQGIGSLANATGRKLRATAAKDSWTKNRETIYEK